MFGLDGKKVQRIAKMRVTKVSLVKHPATMIPAVMLKAAEGVAPIPLLSPALAPVAAKPPDTMAAWAARNSGLMPAR